MTDAAKGFDSPPTLPTARCEQKRLRTRSSHSAAVISVNIPSIPSVMELHHLQAGVIKKHNEVLFPSTFDEATAVPLHQPFPQCGAIPSDRGPSTN